MNYFDPFYFLKKNVLTDYFFWFLDDARARRSWRFQLWTAFVPNVFMACGFSLSHERSQIERKGERERRYIFSSKMPDLYYTLYQKSWGHNIFISRLRLL